MKSALPPPQLSSPSNVGAQSTSVTMVSGTPTQTARPQHGQRSELPLRDWSREDLIELLAHFEGELQARDIALAMMRSDQKCVDNPKNDQLLKSLQSDVSNMNVIDDSEVYVQLYPNQFRHLNRLVEAQKECQKKFAERLLETEDQHARQLFELRDRLEDTEKSIDRTKQGLCAVLEERVEALKNECARKQQELDKLDTELRNRDKDLEVERERQKTIILFLLSERKQLLSMVHQMRLKMKDNPNETPDSNIVGELKKQLRIVCEERNGFNRQCNSLQSEKSNLMNIIHNLEEDIISLKANTFINKPTEIGVGGYVVANKGATSTELPTTIPTQYSDQTGTVRFTRVDKTKGGASSFPTKSFDGAYQHNVINGNVTQRPYTSDSPTSTPTSNLPRPSSTSSTQPQRPHAQPSMGIRGSQLRNSRPAMGVSSSAHHHSQQENDHRFSHPFPTTAADIQGGYSQGRQVRMIPIDHQGSTTTQVIVVGSGNGDGRLTKRSTSLPRKMSNENVVPVRPSNLPSSPSKIRPPTMTNHVVQQGSAPNFQPPVPQRNNQKTGHTHIS